MFRGRCVGKGRARIIFARGPNVIRFNSTLVKLDGKQKKSKRQGVRQKANLEAPAKLTVSPLTDYRYTYITKRGYYRTLPLV